jgi:hypothetical protein
MNSIIETNDEPRKEWAAPELKKIGIEEITAFSEGSGSDLSGMDGTGS